MAETQKFKGGDGTLQVGAVLQQRYKITGVLGVGGMGSVYLARDMHFPAVTRNVAVKEMLNMQGDPSLRELTLKNFEREANILASLSHPAIPKIYDYFSNKDRAYLVMEFINGRDLEAVVNSIPDYVPFEMVRKWATELCDVLNYLHTHQPEPIIFRDIKPSNVMIDSESRVRLIDFGIAKTFQANQKGTMIGTEGYSPPEQYRGEASPQGDIYALGATLHHILTKRDPRLEPPFSFHERSISKANPKVPEDFEKIILRALAYEKNDRYPTAAAMKDAIDGGIRLPVPVMGQGVSPASEFEGAEDIVKEIWKFKVEDEIFSTPVVYKGLIYVGAYDNNLYALNVADGSFRWKYPTDGGISGTPGLAIDDNLIIFGSEDRSLHAIDMRTGKIQWTFQTNGPIRSSVNISYGRVFFGSDDGKLYAVRVATGRLDWKVDLGSEIRSRPAITEDRIIVGTENGEVLALDLAGSVKWRFKAKRAVTSSAVIQDAIAYFGSVDWHVYAVDIANDAGWTAWRYRTKKPILASPLIVNKALYIGSADGFMYGLDMGASGKEIWKFEAGGQIVSTAAFAAGALYFGCVDKKVYSIDAKKGKLRWEFETGGPIASSPCIADGIVYIGSTDHYLYALSA